MSNGTTVTPLAIQSIITQHKDLLREYDKTILKEARASFWSAIAAAIVGLAFFIGAVVYVIANPSLTLGVPAITTIAGAIVEVISGLQFYLYGKAIAQLSDFHQGLERTNCFMLAYRLCSTLTDGEAQNKAIINLITVISTLGLPQQSDADIAAQHSAVAVEQKDGKQG